MHAQTVILPSSCVATCMHISEPTGRTAVGDALAPFAPPLRPSLCSCRCGFTIDPSLVRSNVLWLMVQTEDILVLILVCYLEHTLYGIRKHWTEMNFQ